MVKNSNIAIVRQWAKARFEKKQVYTTLDDGKRVKLYYPYPSDHENKKYVVYVHKKKKSQSDSNDIIPVHFGHPLYEDYSKHMDPERRINYLKRSKGLSGHGKDITKPNFWSIRVLWDGPTI